MTHIRNKNDLFAVIERLCPSSVCRRVFQQCGGTLLGGFKPLAPSLCSGWLTVVKSPLGKSWHIAILEDRSLHDYRYLEIDRIPWECWNPDNSQNPLYAGDLPEQAGVIRQALRKN
jgi:hypothetical protein